MKNFIIVGVVVLVAFGIYKFTFDRLDWTNPEEVTKRFVAALKKNDLPNAGEYWVPAEAEAWKAKAKTQIDSMQSGSFTRFFENLPAGDAVYAVTAIPKQASNEKTLTTEGAAVTLRQIDEKWYVCKAPL